MDSKLPEPDEELASSVVAESNLSGPSFSGEEISKIDAIFKACTNGDVSTLVRLAAENGGFLSDEARRIACQCLMQNLGTKALK